jgi:Ca-activated chloride channel family protein
VSGLAHPDWAPALLGGWLVLALGLAAAGLRARRALRLLGAAGLGAGFSRDATLAAAALLLALALLGPRAGTRTVAVPADGIDLVLLLDVSRSMDAADTPPSRLARAREAARELLLGLAPGDRAALAVFAGHGALLTPLSYDAQALAEMLPGLDSELMSDRGSRLFAGVEAALGAFDPGRERPRVIATLGDGERAHLLPDALLETLGREQVRVVAGAIGSEAGSAIVGVAGPLRDPSGATVVTRRETRGFARLADASGGALLLADEWGRLDAAALLAAARSGLRPGPGGTLLREVPATQTAWPAALALALLLAELLADEPRLRALRARLRLLPPLRRRAAVAALGLLALGAASLDELEERVRQRPDDARALVALGVLRAEAGDPEEAARAFAAAAVRAREPADVALASYDLGVALLEARDFAGARDAFFDALAYDPADRQAKLNLEWALRALASETPPPEMPAPSEEPPPPDAEPEESAAPDAAAPPAGQNAPQPEPSESGEAESAPVALTPEDVARWLDAVQDRPPPSSRRALMSDAARTGPQW